MKSTGIAEILLGLTTLMKFDRAPGKVWIEKSPS